MNRDFREQREKTMEIVRNGEKLVGEVQEMMARMQEFLARHNLDPVTTRERLRQIGGDAAVKEAEAMAERILEESREESERTLRDLQFLQAQSAGRRRARTMV